MTTVLFILLVFASALQTPTATEIIRKADSKMRGNTSEAQLVIRTIRPGWSREMTLKTWMKGANLAMILVELPVKEKGIVYLKRKKEVWNWIPSLEKTIKLPPSMMSQSWMGTDFTNDDLVKEASVVEDYDHRLIGDTIIDNRSCYVIQMLPKPDAAVVWGKLVACIDKIDYLELHTRFYDEEGILVNTMLASEVKIIGGRLIPTKFEMIPAAKPGHKTVMIYKAIVYDRPIDDAFFTVEKMKILND